MFRRAVSLGVSLAVIVTGLTAAPVVAETYTPSSAPDPVDSSPWAPPASAVGNGVPKADAPTTRWSATTPTRRLAVGGVAPNSAPAGTTVGAPGLGALPSFGFDETNLSLNTVARVNVGNGNLLLTSNDAVLTGPGLGLRNDRFYNGLSSRAGSMGGGWSSGLSPIDIGLQVSTGTAVFSGPSGFQVTFTRSGSVWVAPAGFNATLTDGPGGYTRVLVYNRSGEKLTFNSSGWLLSDTDRNGVGNSYGYVSGRLATVTQASGRLFTVTWNAAGTLISSITDSAGRAMTYTQNGSGQLSRAAGPTSRWEEYDYDTAGRISEIRFVGKGSTTTTRADFSYDGQSRVTAIKRGTVGATGYDTTTGYAYTSGQTVVTDGLGNPSTFTIDSSGRVAQTRDPLGHVRSQTWTANSDVATTTDALGTGPGHTTTYSYDALNNATTVALPTGAAASAAYATGVSCPGTGGTVFQPKCSADAAGNGKRFDYDTAGNMLKVTDTTTGGTGAVPETFTYQGTTGVNCGGYAGQKCSATNGNGKTTGYAYDTAGNLITVTPPAPQGATTYGYDSLGRVHTVTDGNSHTTTYAYNPRDAIVTTTFDGGQP